MADGNKKKYIEYESTRYELVDGEARTRITALETDKADTADVNAALAQKQNALTAGQNVTINGSIISAEVDAETIASDVTSWLDANVNPAGSAVVIDSTLSVEGAAADAKIVGDKLTNVKEDLSAYGIIDYNKHLPKETSTNAGITYAYDSTNNRYTYSGTAGTLSNYVLILQKPFVDFKAGVPFHVVYDSTDDNVYLQIYYFVGEATTFIETDIKDKWVTLPRNATGVLIRARTLDNATVNGYFTIDIKGFCTPAEISQMYTETSQMYTELPKKLGYVKVLTSDDDMDDYGDTGAYCYLDRNKPSNAPSDPHNGVVTVVHGFGDTGFSMQLVTTNSGKLYFRNRFTNGYWTPWKELTSDDKTGDTIIENTYNITTSPTITTDANGWLQSVDTDTSDETGKTDMTGAIMSMLTDTGYCHLGEGIFYVSGNIDMPDGSMLCGCGKKTVVRLLQSTTTEYCVKISKFCTIKDISFEGARSFSMPSSKGTRNGIAFMAEYDASPSVTTSHCMISNVWCKYFSGAGIYCHNTSINYAKGVYVSNAFIDTCYVGIDIDYYSEFNKFVNVCTAWCKIGCVNNGGNNVFSNCTFHATDTGFFIDGTQPNNAHGTITGCTFCHIGSNAGKAIHIKDSANGFVINACQIWYNSINIENSSGIVVSNCELGRGTTGAGSTIVINGGDTVMFVGCVFMDDVNRTPDINITNNTKVKFVNCYGSVSGNAISA